MLRLGQTTARAAWGARSPHHLGATASACRRDACTTVARRTRLFSSSTSAHTNVPTHWTCTARSSLQLQANKRQQFRMSSRCFSSQKGTKEESPAADNDTKAAATTPAPGSSTTNPTVVAQQQFQRLQRAVTDLNLGDQVSVVLISVLTILILASPYIVKQIKSLNQDDYDDFWASTDVIDDLTKLARTEWGKEEDVEDGESKHHHHNALETILQDVMQSKALQKAAQQFVVTVVSSEPVKTALNRLLAELFRDLIQDKETMAQVIQLLNKVIQDDNVKRAVQELVLEIVDDAQVKDSLVAMLQQVARQEPVPTTITELLKHSAHATLNDSDILDHSMEFATDVLGDDIVQRTAGEALRNSVGHAVRPASTIAFTTIGLSLLVGSVMAVGYARSSEHELHMFENAVKSFAGNAAFGIQRILTWPGRAVNGMGGRLLDISLFPVRAIGSIGVRTWRGTSARLQLGWNECLLLPARAVGFVYGGLVAGSMVAISSLHSLTMVVVNSLKSLGLFAMSKSASFVQSIWHKTGSMFLEAGSRRASSCRQSATYGSMSRLNVDASRINRFLRELSFTIQDCFRQLCEMLPV